MLHVTIEHCQRCLKDLKNVQCTINVTCLIKKKGFNLSQHFEKLHSQQYSCAARENCDSYAWAVKCLKRTQHRRRRTFSASYQNYFFFSTGTKYSSLILAPSIHTEFEVTTIWCIKSLYHRHNHRRTTKKSLPLNGVYQHWDVSQSKVLNCND